ncbi:MAG: aminoacyl-tRNA hydrolase [Myxococcales bacterium]|nr:aminoacyl-tRNA hydrolase [Myxococcales bacterium]
MLLIVGLGNPGREYESHRHNVGFMVADWLVAERGDGPFRAKFSGRIARLRPPAAARGAEAPIVLEPDTFMNASGDAVQPAAAFFKCAVSDVVVIHDELDLPFGEIRLKKGGGHAGHNGLRSIMSRFGGDGDFCRVRFGIGRPPPGWGDVADYVLAPFSAEERVELPRLLKLAGQTVLDIAARGFSAAANTRNTRPKPKKPRPEPSPDGDARGSSVPAPDADESRGRTGQGKVGPAPRD